MTKKKVSIVAVCLNEAKSVLKILDNVPKNSVDEILVVDGHSKDETYEIVKKAGYKIIYQEGKGRGAAFRTGFKYVTGDIIIMLSTDGNEKPGEIKPLLEMSKEGYDMVIATRFGKGTSKDVTMIRNFGNFIITQMCNFVGGVNVTDAINGYRLLTKNAIDKMNIESNRFDIEAEMTIKSGKLKLKVGELPTVEEVRLHSDSRLHTFRDGFIIFKRIFKEASRKPPY
tara:strand:+ start:1807 stop:2487 length:681 start_codon:yes stop_codon:yes gene_type:complete